MARLIYIGLVGFFVAVLGLGAWVAQGLFVSEPSATTVSVPLSE